MTKNLLLETLRAILVEERDAIRRLDSVAMDRASDAKEAVLAQLHETPFANRGPLIDALAELQPELRHNMILFVHAAALIADARRDVSAATPAPSPDGKRASETSTVSRRVDRMPAPRPYRETA